MLLISLLAVTGEEGMIDEESRSVSGLEGMKRVVGFLLSVVGSSRRLSGGVQSGATGSRVNR
jgi:hypothetical protein